MAKVIITVEVQCSDETMALHAVSFANKIKNYLINQAYESYEFAVSIINENMDKTSKSPTS